MAKKERIMVMEQKYPHYVLVYKDEQRYLINPWLAVIQGYRSNSSWIKVTDADTNTKNIVEIINSAFEYVRSAPIFNMAAEEKRIGDYSYFLYENRYKSLEEFTKSNIAIMINAYSDGKYSLCAMKKFRGYEGYDGYLASKQYVDDIFSDDFYRLFNECISLAEERYKKRLPARKYEKEELILYSGDVISFYPPKDMQFEDMQSGHDACMYRVFEYCTKSSSEPCAAFYLGTGGDLNSDLSEENIRKTWTNARGAYDNFNYETVVHGIFTIRAEMYNDKTHAVSYFAYLPNGDILECTMEVNEPRTRKKTDAKLSRLFEYFSGNIVFSDK